MALMELMNDFLTCFANIVRRLLSRFDGFDVVMLIDNDKIVRMLNKPLIKDGRSVSDTNLIAEAIADYVNFLDRAIKLYFENADNRKQAVSLVDSHYNERIKTLKVIL